MNSLIPVERIENQIYLIRGQKVMLDIDLAELYAVPTKRLNEQVKRNIDRFPSDFMFRLTTEEKNQVVANCDHLQKLKYSHQLPCAFTEQGVAMLSSVLHSKRAIYANIIIMRAFVRINRTLASHIELSRKLKELEGRVDKHDLQVREIFEAIQKMIAPPDEPKRKIGFI
jgi:hypothetical protein